ncbi:hypothetical protein ACTFIR_011922 [Dictyostelium discoideum]
MQAIRVMIWNSLILFHWKLLTIQLEYFLLENLLRTNSVIASRHSVRVDLDYNIRDRTKINRKKNFGDCCTFSNSYVQQGYGNISKWSTTQPNITKKGVSSILELTSLDDITSQVCLVRHLATYLIASKGRRKTHSLLQYFDDLFVHSKLDYIVYFFKIIRMLLYCKEKK